MRRAVVLLLFFVSSPLSAHNLTLQPVVGGLDQVTSIASAGDARLFFTEQTGLVRVWDGAALHTFLDLRDAISCCGERGLLSIAFHPRYAENGYAFVAYTDAIGRVVVARYRVSADDPNRLDPATATPLLELIHIGAAHNGGALAFGPDGDLYISVGDGGDSEEAGDKAQDLGRYLGKILRVDVDHGDPYAVPADNPFVADAGVLPEIWAYGLRNPWRFSFDRETGDLWIADVGQNAWEEIDFQPAGSAGGANYGWPVMEGRHCYDPPSDCDPAAFTLPIIEYGHDQGCAIIGGYRYRGQANPLLRGAYVFADYCADRMWTAEQSEAGLWIVEPAGDVPARIRTFGEDASGELYAATADGTVWRIVETKSRQRSMRAGR
jgi:glucose/arabinose dehydrogenase